MRSATDETAHKNSDRSTGSNKGDQRARPRRKAFGSQRDLVIHLGKQTGPGLCAKLIDCSNDGIRLELEWPVEPGATVNVAGEIDSATGRTKFSGPCKVRWCTEFTPGKFAAGFAFAAAHKAKADPAEPQAEEAPLIDHYEILQLSHSADAETIRRVFHVMASRYHPDNKETGNAEMFRQMVEAHEVLSDPEKRAALDARLAAQAKGRAHLFKTFEESKGVEAEIRKRQGILRLLYTKRMTEAHAPSLSSRDFEELLAIPREHLEFSFWLLKESKLITRADNNRFEITVQGVLAFESEERSQNKPSAPAPIVADLLPAPQ